MTLDKSGGTEEEERQLAELAAEHPWCLTLRDFIDKVRSDYGFAGPESFRSEDPKGQQVENRYLIGRDGERVYLPGGLGLDDQLDELVTSSLCRRMRIPPENFGLQPEDD